MTINGEPAGEGYGRDVLGHPLDALAWLANTLAGRGKELRARDTGDDRQRRLGQVPEPRRRGRLCLRGAGGHTHECGVMPKGRPAATSMGSKLPQAGDADEIPISADDAIKIVLENHGSVNGVASREARRFREQGHCRGDFGGGDGDIVA